MSTQKKLNPWILAALALAVAVAWIAVGFLARATD